MYERNKDLQELTKAIKDMTRVFRDLVKVSEAVNRNIVEIERRRLGEVGIEGLENLKSDPAPRRRAPNHSACFKRECDPESSNHYDRCRRANFNRDETEVSSSES